MLVHVCTLQELRLIKFFLLHYMSVAVSPSDVSFLKLTFLLLELQQQQNDMQLIQSSKWLIYWFENSEWLKTQFTVYAIYFTGVLFSRISRVRCYSRIQQHAKINLPSIPTQEWDLCICNTSSTVHSARANE